MLRPSMGDGAIATLARRAGAGVIRLVAATYVSTKNGIERERGSLLAVPPELWETPKAIMATTFWVSGDITMMSDFMPSGHYQSGGVTKYFGARFHPDGVLALMPRETVRLMGRAPEPPLQPEQQAAEAEDKRPPVPQAKLALWAKVFLGVHGDQVTESFAWRSAKAMFPDSAVSRQRVRELLPPRKPGRPAYRDKSGE
jgi:hypothetical protein